MTRGIGRAIALEPARRGADVAFNYAQTAGAETVRLTKNAFGRIDFLVDNAGVTRDKLTPRAKEEDWEAFIDTNLKRALNVRSGFACVKGRGGL